MLPSPSVTASLPRLPDGLRVSSNVAGYVGDRSGRQGAVALGVVRPTTLKAVESLVQWANKTAVPLVPVSSRGGPRRHGDTVSPVAALIVDLSDMNRVLHVDGRDAVAVIEAGVTFSELDNALRPHGLKAFHPLLPRSSKSVLAAFLEREPMTVPAHHWDSADPLASMELVFGNGDLFRTGGAALPGTIEENIRRGNRQLLNSGPGQTDFGRVVQGAQGSLAIVPRASILCHRVPAVSDALFVFAEKLAPVVQAAYAMLRERYDGQLFIVNGVHLALMLATDAASFAALRAGMPAWAMFMELTADHHFPDEAMAYRRADLEQAAAAAGAAIARNLGGADAQELAAILDRPTEVPYKDRAGRPNEEVFFLSQLSRVQGHVDVLGDIADPADTAIYLQPMNQGVSAHCEFTFLADTQTAAVATARLAAERFAESGAFFSRPTHLWADLSFVGDSQIVSLLEQTKAVLDPNGVLQPHSQALGQSIPLVAVAQ